MHSGSLPGLLLAARGAVTSVEVIVGVTVVVLVVAAAGLAWAVSRPMYDRQWRAHETRLQQESEAFRAHMRLSEASSVALQHELERCWQLILAIERRVATPGDSDASAQIEGLRRWVTVVADALNSASSSGR